ncbi:MAG: hypothetical protein ACJAVM_001412 [Sulfitobacter sp.]|jgi:5-bromo-4-chloroindolyl phosphate hydrolysis protein
MAKRFGGAYSPDEKSGPGAAPRKRAVVDPVGGRANVLFAPAVVLVFTSLRGGAGALAFGIAGAAAMVLAAWLLREGLRAQAAFEDRKVARRPAMPRKLLAALVMGIGAALAVLAHQEGGLNPIAPLIFGLCTGVLHLAAFGLDPMKSKGMEGIDTFQQDRVARVVDEAENLLDGMSDAITRARDRRAEARLAAFQDTARDLIRTVQEDPRDLTAARKYLSVYLRGARDATVKFADIYSRTQDVQARDDYLVLLDDLDRNFAARTRKSLLEDRSDLTVEIEVLRERLSREGVRLD